MVAQITTDEFQSQVVDANGPVLVDFFATWCGPCKMMAPVLDELAAETGATVLKVDVDREPVLAQRFNVMSVPTMVVFKGGQPVKQFVGVQPKAVLQKELA